MRYTVAFGQVVLLQVCLCLLLVCLSDGQRASKTGRPAETVKPRRASPTRTPGNRKGAHAQYNLIPWVEPPETCGKRPAVKPGVNEGFEGFHELTALRPKDKAQKGGKSPHCVLPGHPDNLDGFYPSYVLVQKFDKFLEDDHKRNQAACGGALVGKDVVVTTAHCVDKAHLEGVNVTVGINSPDQKERKAFGVERIWLHPHACDEQKSQLMDFAVLILKDNVTYTDYIQPACFQPKLYRPANSEVLNVPFAELTQVCVPSYIRHTPFVRGCDNRWPGYNWLRSSHQCFKSTNSHHMCYNQWGGPLYYIKDKRHVIAGLASFKPEDTCMPNGTYFFDFNRARRSIPVSLEDSVAPDDVDPKFSEEKCFLPEWKLK